MARTREEIERETLRVWQGSAPYWEEHRATVEAMFAPVTRALIDEARITEGHAVLDVGGGAGEPSLTIAMVIGANGSVTCVDPAREMLAAAEREAHRRALVNIKFRECGGESLPFQAGQFDAAVGRLSAMFFTTPLTAVREMLRVVKAGRRISLVVWAGPEVNPFFYVAGEVLARYVPSPPPDPDAPGAFRFAEPGKLARLMQQAGAVEIADRLLQFRIAAPLRLEEFWRVRTELSDTFRDKLAKLTAEQVALAREEVTAAARPFFPDDRMNFPAAAIVVTGRKPNQD